VVLTFSLRDERHSLIEKTLDLEQLVQERSGCDPAQCLARTMTVTLDEAVRQLGSEVISVLSAPPVASIANP